MKVARRQMPSMMDAGPPLRPTRSPSSPPARPGPARGRTADLLASRRLDRRHFPSPTCGRGTYGSAPDTRRGQGGIGNACPRPGRGGAHLFLAEL
eukprot:2550390-Prymnesium_polylepis.1